MDVFEALTTTRAMRRVKPDPIPDEVVASMLDTAIRAPSPGNTQQWRFITVTDKQTLGPIGELYRRSWNQLNQTVYAGRAEAAQERGDHQTLQVMSSARWLADNFAQVPLVVFAYHRNDQDGSGIYPAVWNLMLAARAHGVGTTLTTVLSWFAADEVNGLLGVPAGKGWRLAAAVTCGYPLGRWGVAKRAPVMEITYRERWGEPVGWEAEG
jgi:nitroreductase